MNNQGGSSHNIHLGDTTIFGDLAVKEDLKIDGAFEVVGDLIVDPPNCLKTDCIKPATANGNIDIKTSSGGTIAEFYDDQSIGAFKIFGFGSLNLFSNNTQNAVAVLDAGLGITTAGLRLPSTKLNVNEIQSQSHEVSGNNPKILFTAAKVEITGDVPIEFETAAILTTEIKKDDSGGDLIVRAADGTQVLKVDDNLDELFVGEDADGYRMPKLRGAIGTLLTMSNTGVATYEEPAQTGSTQVVGSIVTPRILYSAGVFENIASSYAGTTVIQANTWSIGDVFTVNIRGEWSADAAFTRTAFFRLDLGQSLLSQVSDDVAPGSLSASSGNPFELFVGLTRISTTEINWVANGWRRDTNNVTRIIKFGEGKVSSYDESLAMDVSILFQDNSTSGAGNPTLVFDCNSGIWAQSTTANVTPVITTSDHTALSNLQLGDAGHNQFALLNGRNGGQILSGSALTAEGLTIRSNSVDPATASITMTSDLNMSSKDVTEVGALSCVSATLDEFLTIGDNKTSSELKFKGSSSGLNRIYVEPNQGIALNILTDTFVSLMAFNSVSGSESVGILKPLDLVGNIVENVIQLDTGAYGDMTLKRDGVDKIVVRDTATTINGDLKVGDYIEPAFTDSSTYLDSTITKTDRNFVGATASTYRWAYSLSTFEVGDPSDYKLIVKINSTTSTGEFGVVQYDPVVSTSTNIELEKNIRLYLVSLPSAFAVVAGNPPGGSVETSNLGQMISALDYVEFRITNNCADWSVYYHGASIVASPTLLYKWATMTTAGKYRFFFGDNTITSSAFDFDTVAYNKSDIAVNGFLTAGGSASVGYDLTIGDNATIGGGLTVEDDLTIGGDVKNPESLSTRVREGVDADGMLIGYLEPTFDSSSTYLSSGITKIGRNYASNTDVGRKFAISPESFTCGTTTDKYKLITRFNSGTGTWAQVSAIIQGWTSDPDDITPTQNIQVFFDPSVGTLTYQATGSLSGSIVINNIASQFISAGDYMESRLVNNCSDYEFYYHGQALVAAPTLLLKWSGIVGTNSRWAFGDSGSANSSFNFDTIKSGLSIADNLTVDGSASIGGRLTQFADILAVPSPVMSGLFTQTADRLISNIGAPPGLFTIFGAGLGNRTVPADVFIVGSSFFTKICGIFPNNGNQNYDLDVQINNASVFPAIINFAGNFPTNSQWDIELEFVVRSVGVTGSIIFNGLITTIDSGNLVATSLTTENPFVLNTTIANTLDIKVNPQTNGTSIKSQTARINKVY